MPRQITARRIAGDVYELTSDTSPRFTDRSTWDALCLWADKHGTERIDVHNAYRGGDELERISYQPAIGVKFAELPRPCEVRDEIVTRPQTLSERVAINPMLLALCTREEFAKLREERAKGEASLRASGFEFSRPLSRR